MKSLAIALLAVVLISSTGCECGRRLFSGKHRGACGDGACGNGECGDGACGAGAGGRGGCGPGGCIGGMAARHADARLDAAPTTGPATGAVAYPYYTTRGPRDFLNPNPPSIGY